MTRQPHREPRSHSTTAGFCLHADVGGGGDTYTTFRGFQYFILFVCEATGYVWGRFLKKKSEKLSLLFRIWSRYWNDSLEFESAFFIPTLENLTPKRLPLILMNQVSFGSRPFLIVENAPQPSFRTTLYRP